MLELTNKETYTLLPSVVIGKFTKELEKLNIAYEIVCDKDIPTEYWEPAAEFAGRKWENYKALKTNIEPKSLIKYASELYLDHDKYGYHFKPRF